MRRVHRKSSLLITFWLGRVAGIQKEAVDQRTMPSEDAGLSTWLASMVENFRPTMSHGAPLAGSPPRERPSSFAALTLVC